MTKRTDCTHFGVAISLAAALMAIPAHAQSDEQGDEKGKGGFLVLGAAQIPEFEGSDDTQIVPFAVGQFSLLGADVTMEGLEGRINVIGDTSIWRAGPVLGVRMPRGSDVAQRNVALLDEVDLALEAGGFVGFETLFGGLKEGTLSGRVKVRQDVLGGHDGLIVTPEIEYFFAVNRLLRVGTVVNTTWASDNYMDSYFDVNAAGANASGLSEYDAGAGFKDVGVELYSILSFSEQWGAFSRVAYNKLIGDAADSSIVTEVGSEDQFFLGAGVFYRW